MLRTHSSRPCARTLFFFVICCTSNVSRSDTPDLLDEDPVCGAGWDEYARLHSEILAGYRDARFVVFEPDPWRGYANQQFGIVSSLALALLSDRALLIHGGFWKDIFEGARVRWDASLPDDEGISTARLDNMKDCDAETLLNAVPEWDLHRIANVRFPESVVRVSTNVAMWPAFARSRRHGVAQRLWSLRDPDAFFGCAMRFLLRPSKKMEGALEPLQDKLRGKFSLGLQLRLNDETAQVRTEDVSHFVTCARHVLTVTGIRPDHVRWVVATDVPDVIFNLKDILGQDSVVWWDAPQDDGTGREDPGNDRDESLSHALKRAVDHWLLSLCNITVVSFASTFGLSAVLFHPGGGEHLSIGRYYHQAIELQCEHKRCGLDDPCFPSFKAFSYFGLCDADAGFNYFHGAANLQYAADLHGIADQELMLPHGPFGTRRHLLPPANAVSNSSVRTEEL